MKKVTLDPQTLAALGNPTEMVELCDADGTVLAYALPPVWIDGRREPPPYGPFTDEELDRAFAQTGPGRPLADIVADLRKK